MLLCLTVHAKKIVLISTNSNDLFILESTEDKKTNQVVDEEKTKNKTLTVSIVMAQGSEFVSWLYTV